VGGFGAAAALKAGAIDAHSKQSGEYTEKVNVGGKDVYLTKAGAEAYEAFKKAGDGMFEPKVVKDGNAIAEWLMGHPTEAPSSIGKK